MAKQKPETRIYREWMSRTKLERLSFCPFCLREKTPFVLRPDTEWTRHPQGGDRGYLAFKIPYFMAEFIDGFIHKGDINDKGFYILATASLDMGDKILCRRSCPMCWTAEGLWKVARPMKKWLNGVRGAERRASLLKNSEVHIIV